MGSHRRMLQLVAALSAVALLAVPAAAAPGEQTPRSPLPGCADDTVRPGGVHPGGDWPEHGFDAANTRHQPAEKTIGPNEAMALEPVWSFSSSASGGAGDFTGTPIVVDGCVYVGSNRGWVFAFNADTGALVWKAQVPRGGTIAESVAVHDGLVIAPVTAPPPTDGCGGAAATSCVGPYLVAFDQATGAVAWHSEWLDDQVGSDLLVAPVVADVTGGDEDAVIIAGISGWGAESDFSFGGDIRYAYDGLFVIVNARTGDVVKRTFVIADDPTDRHAGCGIWSSAAVDAEAGVAYLGTSNPFMPDNEHERCNGIIKVGIDPRDDDTFGEVLASAKGAPDEYVSEFTPTWHCAYTPIPLVPPSNVVGTCPKLDLAVGSHPNLFTTSDGRKLVGVGQKSGMYFAWDAQTMERRWERVLGIPTLIGGIVGGAAFDGEALYGQHTAPGYTWSVDADAGLPRWVGANGPVSYGNSVTVANGVAYMTDQKAFLNAYDTATGVQLLARPLWDQTGGMYRPTGAVGGIAVARNTVYVAYGDQGQQEGLIVALRPGRGSGLPRLPEVPEVPEVPAAGAGAHILASPGFQPLFLPPEAAHPQGQTATFTNLDPTAAHDVASVARDPLTRQPLFQSDVVGLGQTVPITGTAALPQGSYDYRCSLHPGMTGTLRVL